MSKHAGTKVIFVDKNQNTGEREAIIEALEAFSHKK